MSIEIIPADKLPKFRSHNGVRGERYPWSELEIGQGIKVRARTKNGAYNLAFCASRRHGIVLRVRISTDGERYIIREA